MAYKKTKLRSAQSASYIYQYWLFSKDFIKFSKKIIKESLFLATCPILITCIPIVHINGIPFDSSKAISYHQNKNVAKGSLAHDHIIQGIPCAGNTTVHFFSTGELWIAALSQPFSIGSLPLAHDSKNPIQLYSSGAVNAGTLAKASAIDGHEFRENTRIFLNEKGSLEHAYLYDIHKIGGFHCRGWVKFFGEQKGNPLSQNPPRMLTLSETRWIHGKKYMRGQTIILNNYGKPTERTTADKHSLRGPQHFKLRFPESKEISLDPSE